MIPNSHAQLPQRSHRPGGYYPGSIVYGNHVHTPLWKYALTHYPSTTYTEACERLGGFWEQQFMHKTPRIRDQVKRHRALGRKLLLRGAIVAGIAIYGAFEFGQKYSQNFTNFVPPVQIHERGIAPHIQRGIIGLEERLDPFQK